MTCTWQWELETQNGFVGSLWVHCALGEQQKMWIWQLQIQMIQFEHWGTLNDENLILITIWRITVTFLYDSHAAIDSSFQHFTKGSFWRITINFIIHNGVPDFFHCDLCKLNQICSHIFVHKTFLVAFYQINDAWIVQSYTCWCHRN